MNKKISKLQIFRFIIQILCIFLLPGLFILVFNELKQIYLMVYNGKFNLVVLLPRLVEVFVAIPITVLLGRFFCGWFCAFGAYNDFVYMIASKVFKIRIHT